MGRGVESNLPSRRGWTRSYFNFNSGGVQLYFKAYFANFRTPLQIIIAQSLSLGYLKDTKFYRESKASFTHISSIASFKPFLIAWLCVHCTFSVSSVVSLKSSSWPKYTQYGTIFQKKFMFYYQTFFLFQMSSLFNCS